MKNSRPLPLGSTGVVHARYPYRRVYKADGVRIYHKAWWWCGCTAQAIQ
jgi:hypothetical protein